MNQRFWIQYLQYGRQMLRPPHEPLLQNVGAIH